MKFDLLILAIAHQQDVNLYHIKLLAISDRWLPVSKASTAALAFQRTTAAPSAMSATSTVVSFLTKLLYLYCNNLTARRIIFYFTISLINALNKWNYVITKVKH